MNLHLQVLAQVGAERVINSIPAGLLIAAFAWVLLRLVGKQDSGTRFAVWFSALVGVVAAPFIPAAGSAVGSGAVMRSEFMLPAGYAVAFSVVWILVTGLAAFGIVFGLWKLHELRINGRLLSASDLPDVLRNAVDEFQLQRRVKIYSSRAVQVPTAIGFFNPAILIPEWTLQELSPEELRIVLLHELAHLRRWDDWSNLAQKVLRSVFFFHPAVWWIERRLLLEREMACDDVVLAQTVNPRAYAECLVSLAEKSVVRKSLALGQAAVGHVRDTSLRLVKILDANRVPGTRAFRPALGVVAVLAGVFVVARPGAPRLVAFEDSAASPVMARELAAQTIMPPLQAAAVVPVTLRLDRDAMPRKSTRTAGKNTKRPVPRDEFLAAAHRSRKASTPRQSLVVNAAAKRPKVGPQFLVVMQTTEYDSDGSSFVRFSVWKVSLTSGARNSTAESVAPKSL